MTRSVVVVQRCQVFLELKSRVELVDARLGQFGRPLRRGRFEIATSCSGTKGGPAAISAAFVPG